MIHIVSKNSNQLSKLGLIVLTLLITLWCAGGIANNNKLKISIIGVYEDHVLVSIDKKVYDLQKGTITPDGVRLVNIGDSYVVIDVNGEIRRLSYDVGEPEKSVILYAPFDGNAYSEGRYDLKGKVQGDEVVFDRGASKNAVFIGGAKDWIDFEFLESVDYTSGVTIELWFNRDKWLNPARGSGQEQTLINVGSFASIFIYPRRNKNESFIEGIVSGPSGPRYGEVRNVRVRSAIDCAPYKQWVHTALVYDETTKLAQLFVNGYLASEGHVPFDVDAPHTNHIRIGTWHKESGAYRGYIDDVYVYGYPRTTEQIYQNYDSKAKQIPATDHRKLTHCRKYE